MPGVVTVVSALAANHSATGTEIEPESDVASDKFQLCSNRLFSVDFKTSTLVNLSVKTGFIFASDLLWRALALVYTVDRISYQPKVR
jgi:hypothetical protein